MSKHAAVSSPFRWLLSIITCVCGVLTEASAQITADAPTQISVTKTGTAPSGITSLPIAGANGRALVFESSAGDLISGDTNLFTDIFYRDASTDQIVRASINSAGVESNYPSFAPSISPVLPGGFFAIAFESSASNLGSINNDNFFNNIIVHFPTVGITENGSPAIGFTQSTGRSSRPSITAVQESNNTKKVYVVFTSSSSDLTAADNNNVSDIFLSTITPPTSASYDASKSISVTRLTSAAVLGEELDGDSFSPQISADGRYVVFASRATNLVSPAIGNSNRLAHIFRYDIQTGTTILISKSSANLPGNDESSNPRISFNGRYIAYMTYASDIAGTPSNESPILIRYDALTDSSRQVNLSENGLVSGGIAGTTIGMSQNGRLITFADSSESLVSGDSNGLADIFVKDMETGKISKISQGADGGQANGRSSEPTISARTLNGLSYGAVFQSTATNLTSPSTTNGQGDIFGVNLTIAAPALSGNTRIDTPPDVTVAARTLTFTAQEFALPSSGALNALDNIPHNAAASSRSIRYEFEIIRSRTVNGRKRIFRNTTIAKRNLVTVAKARGNYLVRNRVRVINTTTKKTVSRTPFGPRQSISVN